MSVKKKNCKNDDIIKRSEPSLSNSEIDTRVQECITNLKILANNKENFEIYDLKKVVSSFKNLKVENGKVEFESSGKKHIFENIDYVQIVTSK